MMRAFSPEKLPQNLRLGRNDRTNDHRVEIAHRNSPGRATPIDGNPEWAAHPASQAARRHHRGRIWCGYSSCRSGARPWVAGNGDGKSNWGGRSRPYQRGELKISVFEDPAAAGRGSIRMTKVPSLMWRFIGCSMSAGSSQNLNQRSVVPVACRRQAWCPPVRSHARPQSPGSPVSSDHGTRRAAFEVHLQPIER
jgi:hypothetical protein